MQEHTIFPPDKRIKLGIWGLGRGLGFIQSARMLNIDVVAGCDFNATMREDFQKRCPAQVPDPHGPWYWPAG